jgi:hypothetical protein
MLSRKTVTVRHTLLAVGAVLVLGMTIYLVREVSRSPSDPASNNASASATEVTPTRTADVKPVEQPARAVLPGAPKRPVAVEENAPPPPTEETQPPPRILPTGPNPKLDAVMAEANRAYDHGDFDDAKDIARKILATDPSNVRMLRIMVSSECIAGDAGEAQKYFTQLPEADRAQMRTRCDRYGVTFKDP